ncbi:MAG: TetR/AcrR family transcriptional regulator [Gaiellaceae bacterium]
MSATRPRLTAEARRAAVLETACRVFCKSSYRGATTAEIARESGVSEPILYRHFPSKRDLYLAVLDEAWERVRERWERVVADEPDPSRWVATMGRSYLQSRDERSQLAALWIQALNEAGHDPKIKRYLRDQVHEVHAYVADTIRRAQDAGGLIAERDPEAEAWIFMSLGLLGTIDRRLGGLVGDEFEKIFDSRRRWMTGA